MSDVQGAQGVQGVQGAQGVQGVQGAQGSDQEIALRTLLVAVSSAQSKSPYSMEEAASIWKAMSVFVRPTGASASQIVQSAQPLFPSAAFSSASSSASSSSSASPSSQ